MLKVAALTALLFLLVWPRGAGADTLLTGVLRDQAGAAIVGASVAAVDGAGKAVGNDLSGADGTFAVEARSTPVAVSIACDYCRPIRRAVDAGEPIVVIVERFGAVIAREPSAADIEALPFRSAGDIASLLPFSIASDDGRIVDRGLDRTGAVLVDGLPFYRPSDGRNFSDLIPAHALTQIAAFSAAAAPAYGGYASGGIYDLRLRDVDGSTSRVDLGDAADIVVGVDGAGSGAGFAASSGDGNDRQAASAQATIPLAGGRLSLDALGLADATAHASGAALAYTTDARRFTTSAALNATTGSDASLVTATARVASHGAFGLEFEARATRATSPIGADAAAQFDAGVSVGAHRQSGIALFAATIAYDQGSDSGAAGAARSAGLSGSLAADLALSSRWTAHAGVVSDVRVPTFVELPAAPALAAGDRRLLFEQSISYTDLRRLRLTGLTYTQRATGSGTTHVNGIGLDGAWQIAPALSLRGWLLRANTSTAPLAVTTEPVSPYLTDAPPLFEPLSRGLMWLSYQQRFVRIDAIVRGAALEGDVRIPLGATYAFSIGSARYDGHRITTFGITRRR